MANTINELLGRAEAPVRSRRLLRSRLVWLVLLSLVAVGAGVAYRVGWAGKTLPPAYRTAAVERGEVSKQVTATGTLSPVVTVTVGSQVTGRVQELLADYNSTVHKGQVIARIDPRLFQAEVDKGRANRASAVANVAKAEATARDAKAQYQRDRGLAAKNLVAQADVDSRLATSQSAEAQVAAARAAVAQARAALNQATSNLAYTTIVSPIDGVVISRSVDVGQTVAASLQAPTVFTIAGDMRKMEVHTSVAESDVGLITEGMPVRFTVDAYPDESFSGTVKQVRYEAQTVQNVVTYDAVVSVANDALKLRPGMTANITFVISERTDVLRVPVAALRYRPASASTSGAAGSRAVWVLRQNAPARVAVTTGISDGTFVEITSGLRDKDQVIVGSDGAAPAAKATASSQRPGGPPRPPLF